jgi:hypothetical protein
VNTSASIFTVLFEDPFWILLCERFDCGRYEVCKITFGAEPKEYDVYDYLLKNWNTLNFGSFKLETAQSIGRLNPKRMQREIAKQTADKGLGTKAQQALKAMREETKTARKVRSREEREAEKDRRFAQRLEKQKEKHRGH